MRFTDLAVERLRPQKKRFMQTEGAGLYLQVLPGGTKKWIHFHRGGKQQWINLGYFPEMNVAEARKRNEEAARFATTDTTGQALNFNSTLRELFKEWHGNAKDKKGRLWSTAYKCKVEYMFKGDVLPILGDKRLRDIRKADIRVLLQEKEKNYPPQALEVYRRLSRIFNYAAAQDYIEVSPMAALDPIGTSNAKDRYLNTEEIKTFLESLPSADMVPYTAHALELILRTGQRPSEVCGANTGEMQGEWWIIPGNRTKNSLEQRVPLTKNIKALFGTANEHGLFFPSPKDTEKPVAALSLSKALRRSLTGTGKKKDTTITIPMTPFTPHDLRRTCATGLGALGFSIEIIAAILNHKPRTVTGIHYAMYQHATEKQTAIEAWERKINAIMSEKQFDNVIPLAR
jgi:integrase